MKKIIIIFIALIGLKSFAQSPLKTWVQHNQSSTNKINQALSFIHEKGFGNVTGKGRYKIVEIDSSTTNKILLEQPSNLYINIPNGNETLVASLVKYDLGNSGITLNNSKTARDETPPLTYRGIVENDTSNTAVTLTLNKNFFVLRAYLKQKSFEIYKSVSTQEAVFYNSSEIAMPGDLPSCGNTFAGTTTNGNTLKIDNTASATSSADKCVYAFLDCAYLFYQHSGSSVQNTIDTVFAIYNDVATAYLNEQINIKVSNINVWTSTDPFRHSNRDSSLKDFAFYYKDNFTGNIATLLDYSSVQYGHSAIAGAIGAVKAYNPNSCGQFNASNGPYWGEFIYADLNYFGSYQNFPTSSISKQVYLLTHETGHLLGSRHTHACVWVIGTNPDGTPKIGALDNCYSTEGSCQALAVSATGGTFMSYCIQNGYTFDFTSGFGSQPGNTIRNFVANNNCLSACNATCNYIETIGNIGSGVTQKKEVVNTIMANGTIGTNSNIILDAGYKIELKSGFVATAGSIVSMWIDGCGGR